MNVPLHHEEDKTHKIMILLIFNKLNSNRNCPNGATCMLHQCSNLDEWNTWLWATQGKLRGGSIIALDTLEYFAPTISVYRGIEGTFPI